MASEAQLRGWRKFIIAFGILVLAFVALMLGKITGDNFVTITLGDMGLYGAANVGTLAVANKNGD